MKTVVYTVIEVKKDTCLNPCGFFIIVFNARVLIKNCQHA